MKIPSRDELKSLSGNVKKENEKFLKKIKKKKPKDLDDVTLQLHNEAFEKFDCLDCANCCSSISPILYEQDIKRLARALKMKFNEFVEEYLYIDDENDYVYKQTPCPFLLADNKCLMYEERPKACREYPHTNRKRLHQILNLTRKNCSVCPPVYSIVEELKKRY